MATSDGESESEASETPTPQPESLRRQQTYAAVGGSALAGLAVTISIAQRFPSYTLVAIVSGVVCAFLLYRLTANSIFPGDNATAES